MRLLTPDFIEFIECCARRDVKFLVVGGYAVAAHGHPRATKDLDVWLLIDPTNAEHVVQALDDFGMGSVGLAADDFLEPEIVIQLGYPPIRIDLLTSITGVTFEECWANRVLIKVGEVEAGFISADDLITNKRASGRPQDLVDADIPHSSPPSSRSSRGRRRCSAGGDQQSRVIGARSVRESNGGVPRDLVRLHDIACFQEPPAERPTTGRLTDWITGSPSARRSQLKALTHRRRIEVTPNSERYERLDGGHDGRFRVFGPLRPPVVLMRH